MLLAVVRQRGRDGGEPEQEREDKSRTGMVAVAVAAMDAGSARQAPGHAQAQADPARRAHGRPPAARFWRRRPSAQPATAAKAAASAAIDAVCSASP